MKAQSPLFEQSALQAKFIKVVNVVNVMLNLGLILYHYNLLIKSKVYHIIRFFSEKTVLDRILTRFLA